MDFPRPPQTWVERAALIHDRARQQLVRAGAVPWRVAITSYKWTGGAEAKGRAEIQRVVELTPPPDVLGEGDMRGRAREAGFVREGVVRIVGISARYIEADLDLLFRPLGDAEIVFIEVAHDTRDGVVSPPRRLFKPLGTPERDVTGLQWTLSCNRVLDPIAGRYDSGAWPRLP